MQLAGRVIDEVKKALIGKDEIVQRVMMGILARGHILLEDIPGVGKTTLALAYSRALALAYKRIQFTPDVLPSDVTGFSMLDKETGKMTYQPGAAMCNLLLADEINRATSRTQSALLEAMEEEQITVDGISRKIPRPFIVIATQNPVGAHGTQLLPDSQMDRFLIRLSIGYPSAKDEMEILRNNRGLGSIEEVKHVAAVSDILAMQEAVSKVFLHDLVYDYIIRLINATRDNAMIQQGASPRASIAVTRMSQAVAYLKGRDYVVPDDIKEILDITLSHRLIISQKARAANKTASQILAGILSEVNEPKVKKATL